MSQNPKEVVVDANVMLDILIETRPRHKMGFELFEYLERNEIQMVLPYHAVVEVASGTKHHQLFKPAEGFRLTSKMPKDRSIQKYINIDSSFMRKYFDASLPYMKASDAIFVMIAKRDNLILISEDDTMRKRAIEAGVDAHSIESYLANYLD